MGYRLLRNILLLFYCCILIGCASPDGTTMDVVVAESGPSASPQGSLQPAGQSSGFRTLSDLTDQFSRDLAAAIPERKFYLDRSQIRDVDTGDVANFSLYLENELESSLSGTFQQQLVPQEAEILLGVVFQRYHDQMRIFCKYHSPDFTVNRSFDYSIARNRLPRKAEEEKLHSKAYQLAANIIADDIPRTVYVKPFANDSCMCASEFSRLFARLVSGEIVRMHSQVQVVGDKPIASKLANTRAIRKKASAVEELATSDAFFVEADCVLEGSYAVNGDEVLVTTSLKELNGAVLNSARVDIDRALIKVPLENETATKLADLVDRKTEDPRKVVKLSTSKSGDFPIYRNGEVITFYAQVKQPLYLYLYAIDSYGKVTLLYPDSREAHHHPTPPGDLIAIPEENAGYQLVAQPPFGMDAVKVFAAPVEIPVPELTRQVATRSYSSGVRAIGKQRTQAQAQLAGQKSIHPEDLVDYYRGMAGSLNTSLYEDSLVVETRP